MRKFLALCVALTLVSACGSDDDASSSVDLDVDEDETMVVCSSLAGEPLAASAFDQPCEVDQATADLLDVPVGQTFFVGAATTLCEDGRVLFWNDLGWGYEGEPFAFHDENAEKVAPADARDSCEVEPSG